VKAAQRVAGDISRRKKVKEKRPSPLLFPQPLKEIFAKSHLVLFLDSNKASLLTYIFCFDLTFNSSPKERKRKVNRDTQQ
jgi:hypothetical protein